MKKNVKLGLVQMSCLQPKFMKSVAVISIALFFNLGFVFSQNSNEKKPTPLNLYLYTYSTFTPPPLRFFDKTGSLITNLNDEAQVRGEDGLEYPYRVWSKLMKAGTHGFERLDDKNPNSSLFLIYKFSEQEIEHRRMRLPNPTKNGESKEGETFNYFSFIDTENKRFKKEDLQGKVLVLNFWSINCKLCQQEIPDLNQLAEDYKSNNKVVFIAIGLDPWVDVKEFLKKIPFNYHLITDARDNANNNKVNDYPINIVVDMTGKIVFKSKGTSIKNPLLIKKVIDTSLK